MNFVFKSMQSLLPFKGDITLGGEQIDACEGYLRELKCVL